MKTKQDIFDYVMDRVKIHEGEINEQMKIKDFTNVDTTIAINKELLVIANQLHKSICKESQY